ncbi:MAG: hypothetical protein PUC50_03075 [Bacteroidales bacterium]|nr:hypothetical protein [Bacteroidales bacterium]
MFFNCHWLTTPPELPATSLQPFCYSAMFEGCDRLTTAPALPATTLADYCYNHMFQECNSLTTAPQRLPATTLAKYCYQSMFSGCTNLVSAPELPATSLTENCYSYMFSVCTSLTVAPSLPATDLAPACYSHMFGGCTNLTVAPELPATTLAEASSCYSYMFSGCTSLVSAPELPATILAGASSCYSHMFRGCTSLVSAPELPATVLASYCYADMFSGCTKINKVTVGFTDWGVSSETSSWLKDVSETGFLFHPVGLIPRYGISYIPEGWVAIPIDKIDEVYTITVEDEYITITDNKKTAMYYDEIRFSVQDRSNDNYRLDKVLINDTEVSVENYKGTIKMSDFLEDIYIRTIYSKVYSITTDAYSSTDKTEASEGETVNVTFNRAGYNLTSATYNGTALTISNDAAQFTMPAANVTIATTYSLIVYNITADEFVTVDKTKATLNDQVSFTVADRTDDGYQLDKVLVNNTEVLGRSFHMADYLNDVTITAQYSQIAYTITTDEYSSTQRPTSYAGYYVYVNFTHIPGYNLTSATYNGTPIKNINYSTHFVMPAANVTIVTTYTPMNYRITTDDYITANKSTATINDQVTFTVADRTSKGFKLEKVLVNNVEFSGNSFDMKDYLQNIEIKAVYTPISYTVTPYDQYVSVDKSTATINDVVNVTIADRTSDNYTLNRLLVNDNEIYFNGYTAQISMSYYLTDVTIKAEYSYNNPSNTNYYTVTTDEYCSVDKSSAVEGDNVTVTFSNRPGYNIESASYNGSELSISDYQSIFTMPAVNVSITTEYTPISYSVTPYDQFISVDKSSPTINDIVNITITDRTSENYTLNRLLVNGNEISFNGYTAQLSMSDYLSDVTIQAEYTYKDPSNTTYYTITTNEYCSVDKYSVAEGDVVTVYINQREGYSVNVYYNGAWLTSNYQASFSMPAEDVYIYAEYTEINSSQYYNVSTDQYSSTDKTQYAQGETVNVTFRQVVGKELVSATYNGNKLTLNGYTASFVMPSNDVSILTEYKDDNKEAPIFTKSEYLSITPTMAKFGDEVTVFVSRRDGYTPHIYINGKEISVNGNIAKFTKGSSEPVEVTVDYIKDNTKTAIAEVSGNNLAVSVYPNPARQGEKLVISIDGGIDLRNAKILIYNTHGALVKRIDHAAEYNETNLKSGIYNGVLIYKNGRQTFRIAVY